MHNFSDMISTSFYSFKHEIEYKEQQISQEMQTSGATINIHCLRSFNYSRLFYIIGIFSALEARLQRLFSIDSDQYSFDNNSTTNNKLKTYLNSLGKEGLWLEFDLYYLAINVLKHGQGRSYDQLIREDELPFEIKRPNAFFCEGDVSEIDVFIKVDNNFMENCHRIIQEICALLKI